MNTRLNPKIEVRPSPIEGKGLFAREPIRKGEQLTSRDESAYVILTDNEFQAYIQAVSVYDAMALGDGKHRVSLVARDDDPGNYGNHSCDPNAETNAGGLVAARDIQANEEITCDYALHSSSNWSMVCHCGAANCRTIVTGMIP